MSPMRLEFREKFAALRQKRLNLCKRSSALRMVHLKREILNNCRCLTSDSSLALSLSTLERTVNDEDISLRPWKKRSNPLNSEQKSETPIVIGAVSKNSPPANVEIHQHLSEIHSAALERGTLRWKLDEALAGGQIGAAQRISDRIAESEAFKLRRREQCENTQTTQGGETRNAKSKRPMWTFQAKERWEAKANM